MKRLKYQILLYSLLTIFSWMIVGLGAARQSGQKVQSLQPIITNEENNHFLEMDDVRQMVREIQQRPIEAVIASHDQLRVNGAVLVGGISSTAERLGCFVPLFHQSLADLLAQLGIGLLPGLFSAVAHLHRVLTRALDRRWFGVSGSWKDCQDANDQQSSHSLWCLCLQGMQAEAVCSSP